MENDEIELSARELQKQIYRERHLLWPDEEPPVLRMFNVETAVKILGLSMDRCDYLYWPLSDGSRGEVAGMVDREQKRISLSNKFRPTVIRFTGAHELGHYLIHKSELAFRDPPIEGVSRPGAPRPQIEREADHFAASYLMQRFLVRKYFAERFRQYTPFPFNYVTAMLLHSRDPIAILRETDIYQRAVMLAGATKFGSATVVSLAELFQVSIQSMAIRLVELELVKS